MFRFRKMPGAVVETQIAQKTCAVGIFLLKKIAVNGRRPQLKMASMEDDSNGR
jgi:hypothetical protein